MKLGIKKQQKVKLADPWLINIKKAEVVRQRLYEIELQNKRRAELYENRKKQEAKRIDELRRQQLEQEQKDKQQSVEEQNAVVNNRSNINEESYEVDSEKKQRERSEQFFKDYADSLYNDSIKQKEKEAQSIREQIDTANRTTPNNLADPFASAAVQQHQLDTLNKQLADVEKQLSDLKEQKAEYYQNTTRMTNPSQLRSDFIASAFYNSDFYKAAERKEQQAKIAYDEDKKNHGYWDRLYKLNGASIEKYKKLRKSYADAYVEKIDLLDKMGEIERWVGLNGLPERIDQLPSHLRGYANELFKYKDDKGETKNLLNNSDFRTQFYEYTVVNEDEFGAIAKSNESKKNNEIDEETLKQDIQNYRIMQEEFKAIAKSEHEEKDRSKYGFTKGNAYLQMGATIDKNVNGSGATNEDILASKYGTAADILERALERKQISDRITKVNSYGKLVSVPVNIVSSLYDKIVNENTYTMGLKDMHSDLGIVQVAKKYNSGANLNPAEKAVLNSAAIENIYNSSYTAQEDTKSYLWPNVGWESLGYMLDFMLTRGQLTSLRTGARAATKGIGKYLAKKAEEYVAKNGVRRLTKKLVSGSAKILEKQGVKNSAKVVDRFVADALYSGFLSNTLGMTKTISNAAKEISRSVQGHEDSSGRMVIDQVGDTNFEKAMVLAEKRNWVENFSEMLGEVGIGKFLVKGAKKVPGLSSIVNKVESKIDEFLYTQAVKDAEDMLKYGMQKMFKPKWYKPYNNVYMKNVLKAGQYHGFFGEVMEEYYGIAINHMLGSQERKAKEGESAIESWWNDTLESSVDIFGGILFSTGLLGAFGQVRAVKNHHKYREAEQRLEQKFGKKDASEIRKQMLFADEQHISGIVGRLLHQNKDDREAQVALLDYYGRLTSLRGAILAEDVVKKRVNDFSSNIKREAFDQGFELGDYRSKRVWDSVAEIAKARAEESIAKTLPKDEASDLNIDKFIEDNGGIDGTINLMLNFSETYSKKDIQNVLSYINSKHLIDGFYNKLSFTIADRAQTSIRHIDNLINNEEYAIVPVKLKDGRILNHISGDLQVIAGTDLVLTDKKELDYDKYVALGDYYKPKVILADDNGTRTVYDIEELEGARVMSPVDPDILKQKRYKEAYNELTNTQEEYLEKFGTNVGDTFVTHDGKKVTVLGSSIHRDKEGVAISSRSGITYSISNADGSDLRVEHVNNPEDFKKFVEESDRQKALNITGYLTDLANQQLQFYAGDDWETPLPGEETTEAQSIAQNEQEVPEEPAEGSVVIGGTTTVDNGQAVTQIPEDGTTSEQKQPKDNKPEDNKQPETKPEQKSDEPKNVADNAPIVTGDGVVPVTKAQANTTQPTIQNNANTNIPGAKSAQSSKTTDPQQKAIDHLNKTINEYADKKKGVTGFHYLIEENGKQRLYRRVHTVIGNRRKNENTDVTKDGSTANTLFKQMIAEYEALTDPTEKQIEDIILKGIAKAIEINEHQDDAEDETKRFTRNLGDGLYSKYIHNHKEDYKEAFIGVATILSESEPGPSVIAGNIIDVISREFFSADRTTDLNYEDPRLKITIDGVEYHISDKHEGRTLVTEEAFGDIISQMQDCLDAYNTIGWKLITTPFTMSTSFQQIDGTTIYVAGETDAIAVDQDGELHIIDFKTYNYERTTKIYHDIQNPVFENGVLTTKTTSSQFFEKETPAEEGHGYQRSSAVQYAMQIGMYKLMLTQIEKCPISGEVLMMGIHYNRIGGNAMFGQDHIGSQFISIPGPVDPKMRYPNRIHLDGTCVDEDVKTALQKIEHTYLTSVDENFVRTMQAIEQMSIDLSSEDRSGIDGDLIIEIDAFNERLNEVRTSAHNVIADYDKAVVTQNVNVLISEAVSLQTRLNSARQEMQERQAAYEKHKIEVEKYYEDFDDSNIPIQLSIQLARVVYQFYQITNGNAGNIENISHSDEEFISFVNNMIEMRMLIDYCKINGLNVDNENIAKFEKFEQNAKVNLFDQMGFDYEGVSGFTVDDTLDTSDMQKETVESSQVAGLIHHAEKYNNMTQSHAVDDESKMLTAVTHKPDFITNGEFYIQRNGSNGFQMVIVYDGVEYTPVDINIPHKGKELTSLGKKLRKSFDTALSGGKTRIKLTSSSINRTPGIIRSVEDNNLPVLLGDKIYDIEYSDNQTQFCLTKTMVVNGKMCVVATTPNANGDRSIVYSYNRKNSGSNPSIGTVVMMHTVPYEENAGKKPTIIPVNVMTSNIQPNDAELITDILAGRYAKNGSSLSLDERLQSPFLQGNKTLPLTNLQVLEMLISYGTNDQVGEKQHVHIEHNNSGEVRITGFIEGQVKIDDKGNPIISHSDWFDLNKSIDRKHMIDYLTSNIRVRISDTFMKIRFNFSENRFPVEQLADAVEQSGGKLQFGNSSIKFTIDDFSKDVTTGKQPISGLGWYIKNGFLTSPFAGYTDDPIIGLNDDIEIDNTDEIVDAFGEDLLPHPETPVEGPVDGEGAEFVEESADDSSEDESAGLMKQVTLQDVEESSIKLIDETEARERIREILGDVDVRFEDDFLAMTHDSYVLGRCYANVIQLSRKGVSGIEYHEAFHRIVELLLTDKERAKIYKQFRTQYMKKGNEAITDKELAERIADHFMYFMNNRKNAKIKWSWNILKMFRSIKQWIDFYKAIGSFGLYRFYRSAANGKFKNAKPTKEQIARFTAFANMDGGLNFQINGHDFKKIHNKHEFNVAKDSLMFILLHSSTQTVRDDGSDISKAKTDIDTMLKSKALNDILTDKQITKNAKQILIELLGIKTGENGAAIRRMKVVNGKKTFDSYVREEGNNDWEAIKPYLIANLNMYQMKATTSWSEYEEMSKRKDGQQKSPERKDFDKETTLDTEEESSKTESAGSAATDGHTKNSDEFAQIDRASKRVKFFFSRIPSIYYANEKDKQGNLRRRPRWMVNELGLPQFLDVRMSWNIALNDLHDVESPEELYSRVRELAQQDPMYELMYKRLTPIVNAAFQIDENGHFINNQTDVYADDAYGIFAQIYSVIKSSYTDKLVALTYNKGKGDEKKGATKIQSQTMQYMEREYRFRWSAAIASGELKYIAKNEAGEYVMRDGLTVKAFKTLADNFNNMYKLLNGDNVNFVVPIRTLKQEENGKWTKEEIVPDKMNLADDMHLDAIKKWFVDNLADLGIQISVSDLDYILKSDYGSTSATAFRDFLKAAHFSDGDKHPFTSIVEKITPSTEFSTLWSNEGVGSKNLVVKFISMLSRGKYNHDRSTVSLSAMTVANKKLYVISENNFITSRLDELQRKQNDMLTWMSEDPYYMTKTEKVGQVEWKGSRILSKLMNEVSSNKLKFVGVCGFKSDMDGSQGVEYTDQSEIEDYIMKYALLAQGYIICPTLSDKTTYGAIQGAINTEENGDTWFGFNYYGGDNVIKSYYNALNRRTEIADGNKVYDSGTYVNGDLHIYFPEEVLKQHLQYFETEYNSAVSVHDRMLSNDFDKEKDVVENVHQMTVKVNGVEYNVAQGARLSSFTGIIQTSDNPNEDGKFISFNKIKNEDGSFCSDNENLNTAYTKFFSKSTQEKYAMIERILSYQVQQELNRLMKNGCVSQNEDGTYKNEKLDIQKVEMISKFIFGEKENVKALIAYVADMTIKANISQNEISRIYYGNPASFKWKWDENTGYISDETTDLFKRLGGLVSTGTDNFDNIPGVSKYYTVAEMDNDILESPQFNMFKTANETQSIRNAVIAKKLKDANIGIHDTLDKSNDAVIASIEEEVNNMSFEQQKSFLGEEVVNDILSVVAKQTNKLGKIDVNDGATYITDEMCEILLKQVGAWDSSIRKAFDILRGKDKYSNADMRTLAEAYNKVYTTVIGTQKYTAYGQRPVTYIVDGKEHTVLETYYDKTALFPIFDCMATGPLKLVLQKMRENKDENGKAAPVMMLKVHSATKAGSKGRVNLDHKVLDKWNTPEGKKDFESFRFNTYTQRFSDIRRQFNTDPKEKELMSYGTQAIKVVLASLIANQKFDFQGEEKNAAEMVQIIMQAINHMCKIGSQEFLNKYIKNGQLDQEAFSKMLQRNLSDRDANDEIIEAVSTVVKDGVKKMKAPLASLSGTNWIQSIVASMINKDVIDVNTPGNAFYQRSVWGMQGITEDKLGDRYAINNGKPLQMINEEGSMDCVLSIDYFNYLWEHMPRLKYQSFEVKKAWLIKNGIISGFREDKNGDYYIIPTYPVGHEQHHPMVGEVRKIKEGENIAGFTRVSWHNAEANIVGYRIPTQAISSIHALRCVDVLPVVRDTIVLPAEITAITGSDKQYQCSNQYNIKNPFNCWKLLNQLRQPAAKTLRYTLVE